MKHIRHIKTGGIITLLLFLGSSILYAQDLRVNWAFGIGSSGKDRAKAMDMDNQENIYVAGIFTNTVDTDPSSGTAHLTSNGDQDIFVTKYNPSGDLVWAFSVGGSGREILDNILVDQKGNVLITGRYQQTVDFDPSAGSNSATSNGSYDMFLAKYDPNGNFIWQTSMGGTGIDAGYSIAANQSNEYFICGYFDSTASFANSSTQFVSQGYNDIFIAKYSEAGQLMTAHSFGAAGTDLGINLTIDNQDNVYMTGRYQYTVNFDPASSASSLTAAGTYDGFVARYDANLNHAWSMSFGGDNYDNGQDIRTDANGNIYVTGGVKSSDPSFGSYNFTGNGLYDICLFKLNSSGVVVWAKLFGESSNDAAYSVIPDNQGYVFMGGTFRDSVDFGNGMQYAGDSAAAFLTKFDDNGNLIWSEVFPNNRNDEYVRAIELGANGEIYATGWIADTTDFDPQTSQYLVETAGDSDGWVAKFEECSLRMGSKEFVACFGDSVWVFDQWVSQSTTVYDTVTNTHYCDSVYASTVTILNSNQSVANITGTISLNDTAITAGGVILYQINATNPNEMILIDSVAVATDGSYSFDSIPPGTYRIKSFADTSVYDSTVPTYYDTTNHWQKAQTIDIGSCKDSIGSIDINLIDFSTLIGFGHVSGKVTKGTKNGVKVSGLDIYAIDNSNDQTIGYTITDENGDFTLSNLPEGTYLITAEIPGYTRATDQLITISSEVFKYEYELCLDSVQSTVTACFISGTEHPLTFAGFELYPNPANKHVSVAFDCTSCKTLMFRLIDLSGRTVLEQEITGNQTNEISIKHLDNGIYMYHVGGLGSVAPRLGRIVVK